MMTGEHDLHTLVGGYVLGALSENETAAFEAHLASCAQCGQETRELLETAARLGTASAVRPRPELRQATIQAAQQISQLAPVMPGTREPKSSRPRSRNWPAPRSWQARAVLAAVVVAVAGLVGASVVLHDAMRQLHQAQRQQQLIITVLNAPDAVMRSARVSGGGMATVVLSQSRHMGVFTARRLRVLPRAMSYELWVMGPSGDRPAGMITAAPGAMARPAVVSGIRAGDMIGLTIEPASGSPRPTSPPLVLIGPGRGR